MVSSHWFMLIAKNGKYRQLQEQTLVYFNFLTLSRF